MVLEGASTTNYPRLPEKIVLLSTKSYFPVHHTIEYLTSLLKPSTGIIPISNSSFLLGIIPDYLSIYACASLLQSHVDQTAPQSRSRPSASPNPETWPLALGAQDCHFEADHGAYTGSIVAQALPPLGVTIVELGHAERRRPPLSESNELVAMKARCVSEAGMIPLICIGERDKPNLQGPMSASIGTAMRELAPQILSSLAAIERSAPLIFAYEPVWAIGAAQPAGVDYIGPVVQAIKGVVEGYAKQQGRSGQTKIIYGGSAGPGLWSGQTNGGNPLGQWVDGMFLGRFAHKLEGVKAVVDEVTQSLRQT